MAGSGKGKKAKANENAKVEAADATQTIQVLSELAEGGAPCDELINYINSLTAGRCGSKANNLPHWGQHVHAGCKCTGGTARVAADLIVLIDGNQTMAPLAKLLSTMAQAAIVEASARCNIDLKVSFMGVEAIFPPLFATNHLVHLKALWSPTPPPFATDLPPGGIGPQEGANAIEDLSRYHNWRPDACRAIFYISNSKVDGATSTAAQDTAAVNAAVAAAKANDVTVATLYIPQKGHPPKVALDYQNLAVPTGGNAFVSANPTAQELQAFLTEVVCGSCGRPRCRVAEMPNLEPCISVSWGDSRCDCFETDDTEVVCVTVCNCYSNISFSNFRIAGLIVTLPNGAPVPLLPDGTPSVQIIPLGPTCFGDIPPCRDDRPGCISREFVIRTRGAQGGQYQIKLLGICYDVCFHYNRRDSFVLTLCPD